MAKWASDKKKSVGSNRPVDALFPERKEALVGKKCIAAPLGCGGPATSFKDDISAKEYRISGFCQKCQDNFFG